MVQGKTTNGLMRHLRDNHGITIQGSTHKQQLLNIGYYHGYKGYRFVGNNTNKISYTHFDEVVAVYEYDSNLKSLLYSKIMFIETALKNYTLERLVQVGPIDFEYIFSNLLNDYKKHDVKSKEYHKKMKSRLDLRDKIYGSISYNFSDKKAVIQHFFHKNEPIPLWAIFEVITLGIFGFFIQCLNIDTRILIAQDLDIHSTSHNQNGRILEDIIFLIKDLRNAIAHNGVVFDCRFSKADAPARLKEYLQHETKVDNITFHSIVDYIVIVVFILKKLGSSKTDLRKLIRAFVNESEILRSKIPIPVYTSIVGSDFRRKIGALGNFV
ncbi:MULTISPECIES: Abi family protein [Paenibacillus]|uniref:CAAX protease n=1 Tax=Paenibacillus vini TaxID=1476024 RepID=A0ABQ4M5N3_9BACL|nr:MULTISPECIES: Abi family protein [Paenibacillus]MBQ4900547.1 Abi family protein [Paenibacillus sp. Marseille-P2973]GIP51313.1 hypothetical protein J42TS3_03480 [Paenibacillus vini]